MIGFREEEPRCFGVKLEEALTRRWDLLGGLEGRVFEIVEWRCEGNESGGGGFR